MSFGHEILEDMPKLTMFIMSIPQLVETIEGSLKVRDNVSSSEFRHSLGTHYVRSVTYGAEMVASLTFKSSSKSSRYAQQLYLS